MSRLPGGAKQQEKPASAPQKAPNGKKQGKVTLPTEKEGPTLSAENAKVLLYGDAGVGKTTLCAGLNPDHTLFLATEPGVGAITAYKLQVPDWETYLSILDSIKNDDHPFKTVVIDTVDELATMARDYMMRQLGAAHPSDLEYGKGWDAVKGEFKLRIAAIAGQGLGVWFISHAKSEEVRTRVGSRTVYRPDMPNSARQFVEGFVDYILFAEVQSTDEGEKRVLHTRASDQYQAKSRTPDFPDPLPLDAKAVTDALATVQQELAIK